MRPISGFLLIDKPRGISSFDVIRKLRALSGIRKIGHTGTLDPLATGLLICAFGTHTRLCKYLEARDKIYESCLKLGEQTDTGDSEGEIIAMDNNIPPNLSVTALEEKVLVIGNLPVPRFSAVKVAGKPAYSYARKGQDLDLEDRPVRISSFSVLGYDQPFLRYRCTVSKGTYIRSLGEEIAKILGTVGHTVDLTRTAIGNLLLKDAHQLDDLSQDSLSQCIYPDRKVFIDAECLDLSEEQLSALRNGQPIAQPGDDNPHIILFGGEGQSVGVARRSNDLLYPLVNLV